MNRFSLLRLRRYSQTYLSRFQKKILSLSMPEYSILVGYGIITGVLTGLSAVVFHKSIDFFNKIFFQQTAEGLFFLGAGAVIVLPALGMLIQSIMISFAPETAKKRGVGEVIKSVAFRGGFIPFRTTLFHFFAPVISIGSGLTVGPEGPAAQLGGGVASKFANLIGLSDSRRRMFTAAGAGAAIAAIFNTPLGGIFFALEVILLNDFQSPTFSSLILASVTASSISRVFLGNEPVFVFNLAKEIGYSQLYLFILLGVGGGIISILFIKYSSFIHKKMKSIIPVVAPRWIVMLIVGLIVGICGYFYSEIFGVGYNAINKILAQSIPIKVILILLIMKFFLVPLVLNSGGFGGTFAPSLFIGACYGSLFVFGSTQIFGLNLDITAFILVAMGALLGGINSIPISAILILFEMTQNYSIILPLMLGVVISTTIVQLVLKGSVHVKNLQQEGYNISSGRETHILRSLSVEDVMKKEPLLIPEELRLSSLVSLIMESPSSTFYTINSDGKLTGVITANEIRPIIPEYDSIRDMIVARDISVPNFTTVDPKVDLDYVMKIFGCENFDELPVVAEIDGQIIGTISRHDIISAYNKESLKYNITDGLTKELKSLDSQTISKIADGYSIIEKEISSELVGKTLSQIRLRNNFNVEVLMIKTPKDSLIQDTSTEEVIMPDPNYKLQNGDKLVIFGNDEKIEIVRKLNW